jgi:hypothetical protein
MAQQAHPMREEWLETWLHNMNMLKEIWEQPGRPWEHIARDLKTTKATVYNMLHGPKPTIEMQKRLFEFTGLDFTEPIERSTLVEIIEEKGPYLRLVESI